MAGLPFDDRFSTPPKAMFHIEKSLGIPPFGMRGRHPASCKSSRSEEPHGTGKAACRLDGAGVCLPGERLLEKCRPQMRVLRGEGKIMKRFGWVMVGLLVSGAACAAQEAAPAGPVANPVTTTVKSQLTRYEKNM